MSSTLLKVALIVCIILQVVSCTYSPVIGMLSQPNQTNPTNQYVTCSYIKWLIASGASVLPIAYDLPSEQIDTILSQVNGMIFPGGDTSLWNDYDAQTGWTAYAVAAQAIVNKAVAINKSGKFFPIWATCLGYETVILAISGDMQLLGRVDSQNHVINTQIETPSLNSRVYSTINAYDQNSIQNLTVLFYDHQKALLIPGFQKNAILSSFFKMTAQSYDKEGVQFVSSLESHDYPIYVNQFHPEKNMDIVRVGVAANHSPQAVSAAKAFGDFFISELRKTTNIYNDVKKQVINAANFDSKTSNDQFYPVPSAAQQA